MKTITLDEADVKLICDAFTLCKQKGYVVSVARVHATLEEAIAKGPEPAEEKV